MGCPGGSEGKESTYNERGMVQSLCSKDPLEKEMATPSSILAWRIPWTEEPGGRAAVHEVGKELDTTLNNNIPGSSKYMSIEFIFYLTSGSLETSSP